MSRRTTDRLTELSKTWRPRSLPASAHCIRHPRPSPFSTCSGRLPMSPFVRLCSAAIIASAAYCARLLKCGITVRPSQNWSATHAPLFETVRPEFTGTIAIKAGRHPILETVQSAGILVPNDVYCSEAASFQIVQGPKYVLVRTKSSSG